MTLRLAYFIVPPTNEIILKMLPETETVAEAKAAMRKLVMETALPYLIAQVAQEMGDVDSVGGVGGVKAAGIRLEAGSMALDLSAEQSPDKQISLVIRVLQPPTQMEE